MYWGKLVSSLKSRIYTAYIPLTFQVLPKGLDKVYFLVICMVANSSNTSRITHINQEKSINSSENKLLFHYWRIVSSTSCPSTAEQCISKQSKDIPIGLNVSEKNKLSHCGTPCMSTAYQKVFTNDWTVLTGTGKCAM